MNAKAQTVKEWPILVLFAICSIGLCLFLFFIDEGNYHLRGIFEPSNFFAFSVYFAAAFLGQALVYALMEKLTNKRQPIMSVLIGAPLGVITLMLLFWYVI